MSKDLFIRKLRGTDDGEDLPSELLSAIYDSVENKKMKTGPDSLDAIYIYEAPWRHNKKTTTNSVNKLLENQQYRV